MLNIEHGYFLFYRKVSSKNINAEVKPRNGHLFEWRDAENAMLELTEWQIYEITDHVDAILSYNFNYKYRE